MRAKAKVIILTANSRQRSLCPMGQIPSIHRSFSSLQIYCLDYQRGRMVKVTPLDQRVDIEDLGSYPGADKLDSGFQLSVK